MTQEIYDWTKFTKKIPIYASVSSILNHWSSQEELEKWFLCSANFFGKSGSSKDKIAKIEVGDSYEWKWHASDHLAIGEILSSNNKDHLAFTFIGCQVDVQITGVASNTSLLEVTQSKIPQDEASIVSLHLGCSRGWTFYMTNLKSILEGGIDLRNKDASFTSVINT